VTNFIKYLILIYNYTLSYIKFLSQDRSILSRLYFFNITFVCGFNINVVSNVKFIVYEMIFNFSDFIIDTGNIALNNSVTLRLISSSTYFLFTPL